VRLIISKLQTIMMNPSIEVFNLALLKLGTVAMARGTLPSFECLPFECDQNPKLYHGLLCDASSIAIDTRLEAGARSGDE
jgi:hypothetical protein